MPPHNLPDYSSLGRDLVRLLTERGLGAIPKRDLEALLLFLVEKHMGWSTETNQQLSLRLRLPLPKIKALRYEGALRYIEDLDAEFRTRLRRLLRQASFTSGADTVEFIIEDYASRFVFEEYLKRQGKLARWSFNGEGITAPVDAVATIIADQFTELHRQQAIQRLGVSDPTTLSARIEKGFLDLVKSAKGNKTVKLTTLLASKGALGAEAKVVSDILSGDV